MKKFLFFVLTLACIASVFLMAEDIIMNSVKAFEGALEEVEQWKTLM